MMPLNMRYAFLFIPAALVAALVAVGTLSASTEDGLKVPADFQRGYLANSMLVSKEPNKTGLIGSTPTVMVRDSKKYASTGTSRSIT